MITKKMIPCEGNAKQRFMDAVKAHNAEFVDEVAGFSYWILLRDDSTWIFTMNEEQSWYTETIFDFNIITDYALTLKALKIGKFMSETASYSEDFEQWVKDMSDDVRSDCSLSLLCEYFIMYNHGEECMVIDFNAVDDKFKYEEVFSPKLDEGQMEIVKSLKNANIGVICDIDKRRIGFIDITNILGIKPHKTKDEARCNGKDIINLDKDVTWIPLLNVPIDEQYPFLSYF